MVIQSGVTRGFAADSEGAASARRARKAMILIAALLAALVVGVGIYVVIPVSVSYGHPSYAFDTSDRTQVAGFADHVVVASVVSVGDTTSRNGPPRTSFVAHVETSLKGSLAEEEIVFCQTGVDYEGKRRVYIQGVAPLVVGGHYVLALRDGDDGMLTLVGGPHSPELVSGPDGSGDPRAVDVWRDAVEHQQWPKALPKRQ